MGPGRILSGPHKGIKARGRFRCSPSPAMEDIEDVVDGGAPPGLRLPLEAVVVKPRRPRARKLEEPLSPSLQIPGTQVFSHAFLFFRHLVLSSCSNC